MGDLAWETLPEHLRSLANGFHCLPVPDCEGALESIPTPPALRPQQSPKFFDSAVLGNFRWQNEAILADLDAINDESECQAPVAGFITGAPLEKPREEIRVPPEDDRYLVFDADFSQERVVYRARAQTGLVVHGPPGTGKSQTIVNLIADALAHGRTVLMVCQKQAATRVVLERLRKVGLADLCMEVHDPESERKPVFEKIHEQVQALPITVRATKTKDRRHELAGKIAIVKQELDAIARGLHEQHPEVGLSYPQIMARVGQTLRAFPSVRQLPSLQSILGGMSAEALEASCHHAQTVGRWFKEADPLNNPWRDYHPNLHISPATQADLKVILTHLRDLDSRHQEHIDKHAAGRPLPRNVDSFADIVQDLIKRVRHVVENSHGAGPALTRRWLRTIRQENSDRRAHYQRLQEAVALSSQVEACPLDPEWDQLCSPLSRGQLEDLCLQAKCIRANRGRWWRFLIRPFRVARRNISRICPKKGEILLWDAADQLLACLQARELRKELADMIQGLVPGYEPPVSSAGSDSRYPRLAKESFEAAVWLAEQERAYGLLTPLFDELASPRPELRPDQEIQSLERSAQRIDPVRILLHDLAGLESFLRPEALEPARDDILAGESIEPWLNQLAAGFEGVQSLRRLDIDRSQRTEPDRTILNYLEDYELRRNRSEVLPAPPDNLPDGYGDWWQALLKHTAATTWLAACERKHPVLIQFDPEQHERKQQRLGDLLMEKRDLEAESIRERWLADQVAIRSGPWKQLFQLRGPNAKRLRQAVEASLSHGLFKLRPCWLVNPGTAAQIFPLKPELFDLVIFDEASQCPIEYAVPAIWRAKTLIVSGDAKQLPPTSFFSANVQPDDAEEEEPEDAEASDQIVSTEERQFRQINAEFLMRVEDLLDASVGNLPEEHLLVHYRSDHPRLIDFSNRAFYHGQLEAPPARMSGLGGTPPIQYHHVNGLYHYRTNRAEARKVVELLKETWRAKGKSPTIGVVTFNLPQRELIEDLVEKECQDDEAFAARYQQERDRKDDNQDVGFFVKNLENVQGDERDTMIFSTTFGPNANGAFYRRFGPVGAERGERRLNVAVTRAKHQIIIVGSMPIEQISQALAGAAAPGANLTPRCYLQLYLAYARAVSAGAEEQVKRILDRLSNAGGAVQAQEGPETPLEEEVLHEIQKLGYEVHCQVGESGFRIDLAVRHSDPNQGYLLGIECDGATYHSDRAAHLRDVWRETILRSRGWKLHRVWSTCWWYHRAEEVEKLADAILSAQAPENPAVESLSAPHGPKCEPLPDGDVLKPEVAASQQQGCAPSGDPPAHLPGTTDPIPSATRSCAPSGDPATHRPASALDEDKTLEAFRRELRVGWATILERLRLPANAFGMGVRGHMTLREARKVVANIRPST